MKTSSVRLLRLAIIALVGIGLAGCSTNKFKSKFNKIQLEMTETQVDEIVLGYHPPESFHSSEIDPIDGEKMLGHCKRIPKYTKIYGDKDAIEGDYVIEVYFDENDLVVEKLFLTLIK
jgi:hypothetical protein